MRGIPSTSFRTINLLVFQFLFSDLSLQIWSATGTLRGSFATFSPKLKIFGYSFAFLDF
jgi:hypothetical protein